MKYRGVVEGRVGTWFGVHLTQLLGNSDGSLEGRFYMGKCQKNSVIFTSIDNLSLPGFKEFHTFMNHIIFVNFFINHLSTAFRVSRISRYLTL